MIDAGEALRRLRDGNHRFVTLIVGAKHSLETGVVSFLDET